jgi:hypothetical protein
MRIEVDVTYRLQDGVCAPETIAPGSVEMGEAVA